jgi:hypothetical protein
MDVVPLLQEGEVCEGGPALYLSIRELSGMLRA